MPLISAPTGPVKLRPDKPGGMQVPNRDKLYINVFVRRISVTGRTGGAPFASIRKPIPMPSSSLNKKVGSLINSRRGAH